MMKSALKKILSLSMSLASQELLIQLSGQSNIKPFYHTVSDSDLWHVKNLYPVVGVKQFNQDLDFFQKCYTGVNARYLLADAPLKSERTFFLSFDDGLSEFHDVIAPILIKRGIPATFFVNTAFVDNKDMFFRMKVSVIIEKIKNKPLTPIQLKAVKELMLQHGVVYGSEYDLLKITDKNKVVLDELATCVELSFTDYLSVHKPYLTTPQIDSLIKRGFTVGSHSCNHTYYPILSEDEQLEETLSSMDWLKQNFAVEERLFSFPYTDFQIRKSFFQRIENEIDLTFGTANLKLDCVKSNLQRIPMEIVGRTTAEQLIKSEYIYFIVKKILGKHIIKRN